MHTRTLTHAHTNALHACTCTVCIYVCLQIIVDKIRRQYLQTPSPLYKPPTDRGCGGCLSHGSMACTLTCVRCGQLSEVTRPHPCVGCGGITSNTLEAFLYYENSICLSCILNRCWGIAYTKCSLQPNSKALQKYNCEILTQGLGSLGKYRYC